MSEPLSREELRKRTLAMLEVLRGGCNAEQLADARGLLCPLRNCREHELSIDLAEAISRIDPDDALARRLYAQALIETGRVTAAVDVLHTLVGRLPANHPESLEATGLLGRAYKQIFFDSRDRTSPAARRALLDAIDAYRAPYEKDPANTWHGVNLLALVDNCRRLGIQIPGNIDPQALSRQLLATLHQLPVDERNDWYLATLAEVSIGTRDWRLIDSTLRDYVMSPSTHAFHLNSTLRQFTQIWNLQDDPNGAPLVDILRARLLQLPGAALQMSPQQLAQAHNAPDKSRLEAILGTEGPKTYRWWQTGLERARSVAAIRQKLAGRIGTGFLVRAQHLGLEPAEELLVLTNFHVVNREGLSSGIRPEEAEVVFEAVDPGRTYEVQRVLWSSPVEECDASVLSLQERVSDVPPLPIARALPVIDSSTRVYVIGHPGGRDLAFSFQDNKLLDHEGPPQGKPVIPGVCRVHYGAPTEGGSSGSPVFNGNSWEVIALHHKGGMLGMPRLNGQSGTYAANEGLWLQSIVGLIKAGAATH
jgi:tetratricopeptide (TPR) repeat protein